MRARCTYDEPAKRAKKTEGHVGGATVPVGGLKPCQGSRQPIRWIIVPLTVAWDPLFPVLERCTVLCTCQRR